jgi:hypothetical protein
MHNKPGETSRTFFSTRANKKPIVSAGQTNFKNPFKETHPLKFPKNNIRKQG